LLCAPGSQKRSKDWDDLPSDVSVHHREPEESGGALNFYGMGITPLKLQSAEKPEIRERAHKKRSVLDSGEGSTERHSWREALGTF